MFKKKKVSEKEEHNKMADNAENQEPEYLKEEMKEVNEARVNEAEDNEPSEADKLRDEVAQLNDKYLRLFAEFENYKRRTSQERKDLLQTAGKDVIVSLLGVLDDFERADKAMENATEVKPVKEGIELVHHKLKSLLVQKGLVPMVAKGKTFDADIHEAITSIPAPSDDLKGKVVDEVEKGYLLNDKVIRFAKVIVGA
ncbi:nucleotide exchange factor GrpE [Pedobacter sp. SD-b]|uniref:Protein GrpE n=1 Tax=Pedobacter segetis TaxID=2793069 RepID=A0ABS1BHY5_9SPHI|nr:nucleotide exchange factor GrpE [Pedobacter segetis]MBK0382457.1 nucleotide exchange factor GrpE [Pedobacter segetis]